MSGLKRELIACISTMTWHTEQVVGVAAQSVRPLDLLLLSFILVHLTLATLCSFCLTVCS